METPTRQSQEEDLGYDPSKLVLANKNLIGYSKNKDGTTRSLSNHYEYAFAADGGQGKVVLRLGRGGQGQVYLARNVTTGQFNTAVKIMRIANGAGRVDVAREVELYQKLAKEKESNFIVMMKDFFVTGMEGGLVKSVAMSFKYYEEGSLQSYADFKGGKLDIADVKTAVRCVARALRAIHKLGFVSKVHLHRYDHCLISHDLYMCIYVCVYP